MNFKLKALAVALALMAPAAQAATVANGATGGTGFTTTAGATIELSPIAGGWNTDGSASWVKVSDEVISNDQVNGWSEIYYSFNLTGFDKATVGGSGHVWFDDFLVVLLNGQQIFAELAKKGENWGTGVGGSFASGSVPAWLLNDGINVLTFKYLNNDGHGGIKAQFEITATPIPVPAALPLLGLALAGLGIAARRKRAA